MFIKSDIQYILSNERFWKDSGMLRYELHYTTEVLNDQFFHSIIYFLRVASNLETH